MSLYTARAPRHHDSNRTPRAAAVLAGALAAAVLAGERTAAAQWRAHVDAHAALSMARPQTDQFGLGGGGGVAVEWAPLSRLGLLARAQFTALAPYEGALPEGYLRPGTGGLTALTLAVRVRPLGWTMGHHSDGLWLEVSGGGGLTGALVRPVVAGRAGVAFGAGAWAFGPWVGYTRVFEVGETLLPGDAQLAQVGLEVSFTAPQRERTARVAPPAQVIARPAGPQPNRCPAAARVTFGDFDRDGCPDADADGDGLADVRDRCPAVGEDLDGFEDTDGCPDGDNDGDQIGDTFDACPNEPEVVNGVDDVDGCPDDGAARVVEGRVRTTDTIRFASNSARLLPESEPVVRAVARVLLAHPEYQRVYVEGHADDIGDETYNYNLSYQRALSVCDELAIAGVSRARLEALGFGRSAPLVRGRTAAARARNRRVEFVVDNHRSTGRARTARGYVQIHDDAPAGGTP